ncbi:MAG: hypothetical protein AAF628_31425 [Planctomycetota bacterium]
MSHPLLLCAVATLAAAPPQAAQSGRRDAKAWTMLAEKYDADGDGTLTPAEYPRGDRAFRNLDRDSNGVIDAGDFGRRSSRGSRGGGDRTTRALGALAGQADADGDGRVTADEWSAAIRGLDADGDAVIAAAELQKGTSQGRRGVPRQMLRRLIRTLDRDGDGTLAVDELVARFGALDQDSDGTLGPGELPGRGRRTGGAAAPAVGDEAPDFDLPLVEDDTKTVRLSAYRDGRPVALIFGSYT